MMIKHFLSNERGVAMVEFGLMLPLLMTLFYGGIEITRYLLIAQKIEKMAHAAADVTAQSKTLTTASIDQVLAATGNIIEPFESGANTRVVISSLYRAPGQPSARVNWKYYGGGTLSESGAIGAVGAVPVMPGGFTFNERENVISAEIYFRFSPLLTSDYFGTTTIYRAAFYKPRLGLLTNAPS
jgi:hypothetical protein